MKILVVQARSGIGDMCLFLPFIQKISQLENKKITILTKKRSATKFLIQKDPHIEEVIYLPKKIDLNFLKLLKKKKFKKSYIFHYGIKYFLLSLFCGIFNIFFYGFKKKNSNISADPIINLKKWFKLSKLEYECKIFFPNNSKNKNNIIIGIGGSGPTKKWSINKYINLITELNKKNNIYKFIIAGGPDEIEDFNLIRKYLYKIELISLCKMNLSEAMNLMVSSKAYIGNDTGFMHVSAMLGIKSLGLFGDTPTNYSEYNSKIVPIMPKGFTSISHNSLAIDKIEVDWVLSYINKEISI